MIKFALALSAAALLSGCATSSDVRNAPLNAGVSQTFDAPYEEVKRLTFESVQGLNVDVKSVNESASVYSIEFAKPMTMMSWGEVGRVNVFDISPQSRVSVVSEKRSRMQITGTDEDEFAEAIFEGIEHALDRN